MILAAEAKEGGIRRHKTKRKESMLVDVGF